MVGLIVAPLLWSPSDVTATKVGDCDVAAESWLGFVWIVSLDKKDTLVSGSLILAWRGFMLESDEKRTF